MLRTGRISSYDKENLFARVYFEDLEIVSDNLPIMESCALPLEIDEYVICIYTEASDGIVLGRLHERDGD